VLRELELYDRGNTLLGHRVREVRSCGWRLVLLAAGRPAELIFLRRRRLLRSGPYLQREHRALRRVRELG
jgi:hypothetical protein